MDSEAGCGSLIGEFRHNTIATCRRELQLAAHGKDCPLVGPCDHARWATYFEVRFHPHKVVTAIFSLNPKHEVMAAIRLRVRNEDAQGNSKVIYGWRAFWLEGPPQIRPSGA